MQADHTALYTLIRDYMAVMGTSRTTLVALKSYADAILRLRCSDTEFRGFLLELNDVMKHTEPRVTPLVHLIEEFEAEMEPHYGSPLETAKAAARSILSRKLEQFEATTRQLTMQCVGCIGPDDFIIAHSPTSYIRRAFVQARQENRHRFKVLVLKQDFVRTRSLIRMLDEHRVDHLVIPEYNLSHYLGAVKKLFIGGVSVSPDGRAITSVGTANVVSLCHASGIPVYLFVESIKFSHTNQSTRHIHQEQQEKVEADYVFHLTTFSHDLVDLGMIDHIITENGETPLA
jgi:translation initiation factor 2B subunit (eIF-2B alpha/beta/delta family)